MDKTFGDELSCVMKGIVHPENEPVKVLQETLGHARIDQTMNTHAHVMPHIQADAFERFSKRFSDG